MPHSSLFTPVAILLGSATIAASLYYRPTEQLAQKKLTCAQQTGVVMFEPGEGIKENKPSKYCKELLGSRIEAELNWPARLWLN